MHLLRNLVLLLFPGLICMTAIYLQTGVAVTDPWQALLFLFPYLAVVTGLFLGWRFNRTRVIWAIVVLIIVERGLATFPSFGREYLLAVAPVIVPLNLVLCSWLSERGLFTMHGLMRLVLFVAQLAGLTWIYISWPGELMAWLERPLLSNPLLDQAPLSQVAMLVNLFCLIALLSRFVRKPEALEGGFFWALVAVVSGFWQPEFFAYRAGVAAFVLAFAVVEGSFKMAFNDELTGLPARRAMNEFLLKVGRRYTVAMVDVDHFKKVNDTHGHDVGDQVLRMVATCLRRVSGGGRAYRYGGEEFAVIFPNKELERALPHLEELRETISLAGFVVRGKKRPKRRPERPVKNSGGRGVLHVTVSIGVASRDEKNSTPELLIKAADQALYKAKKGGRNQVCAARNKSIQPS